MAAPSDLIAPASDYVYVYRGHGVAPARCGCLKWAIHLEMLRSAVAGHWTSWERCCPEHKPSGSSLSVILHFAAQSPCFHTWERTRVKRAQLAWQLCASCRRFLLQISRHFQLTAVASARVFRSHQKMVGIGISPEDWRYVPGQIKKVVHMNFAIAGRGKLSGNWMTDNSRRLNGIAPEQLHVRLGRVGSPESDMKASSFIHMHVSCAVLWPFLIPQI